jgi:hypothetical protein
VDLDSVAQELYGLPLGEFVATRNARAKQARADADRDLAAEIQGLAKPTTAAWLVNQLSREHGGDLEPLLELGRELRDASAKLDGETLRSLGRERNQLVADLLGRVHDVAAADGLRVSDEVAEEVRQTLESSVSDSTIADEVAAGRLTRAVEYAGFGEVVGLGGPTGLVGRPPRDKAAQRTAKKPDSKPTKATKKRPAKEAGPPADLNARRRRRAETEVAEAAQRLEAARSGRDEATEEYERTTAEVDRTEAEVDRLRGELAAAEREAKSARQANRSARQRLTGAERELDGVDRMHDRAKARLAELDD